MTVTEYAASWLKGYDATALANITTDQILPQQGANGLIKSPGDRITTDIIGNKTVTAYLRFYVSRPSINEKQRADNQAWLEGLEDWAANNAHPTADFPRGTLDRIGIASTFGLASQDATTSIYQITVEIIYRKD